jgi:fructan beta-fructosidase
MKIKKLILAIYLLAIAISVLAQADNKKIDRQYRPLIHFTPAAHWMNDPNGMVYINGTYHLFFQYHPNSSVWGPMHWGHASSTDLFNWKEQPIAIYPDSIGMIFSGSAVVDKDNTSGFGIGGGAPLVAIFTQHDMDAEKAGKNDFQTQGIAYSNDEGKTWTKYAGNPVVKNPGIKDFRDPKVMWYEPQKKWIMTLAVKDHITFYASPDLKNWKKQSEFGKNIGAHGGVWECPDLISFDDGGKKVWALIVNLNPGAPNAGSGTQYFLGDFDGKTFSPFKKDTKWLGYGPDDYAGVTWANTGDRKIFLGWMSNWLYATLVPTETWRSAMTIPRELTLRKLGNEMRIASQPVTELASLQTKPVEFNMFRASVKGGEIYKKGKLKYPVQINLSMDEIKDFSIALANDLGEELQIGFDKTANQYFIDRTKSGKTDFHKDFAARPTAPRFTNGAKMNMTLVIDVSSVELFADDGLSVMTAIFFPTKLYNQMKLKSADDALINKLECIYLKNQ